MDKPLLSICSPTFNRCEQLKETIEAIISERAFLDGRVEIVISDNASEDNTEAVGRFFDSSFENIHYYRNNHNIRDENFPTVLGRARGVLRKLNNDTFKPLPGALDYICEIIEKYKDKRPLLFFANGNKPEINENIMPFHEFVEKAGYWVTWIAAFSIWENDCSGIADDTYGAELLLWQVRKTYELGSKKNACVIIDKPIGKIVILKKKDVSYGLYKVFYQNYITLLKPYVEKNAISTTEFEAIRKDLLYNFFTDWIIKWEIRDKRLRYSDKESLKEKVFEEYRTTPYWRAFLKYYQKKKLKRYINSLVKRIFGR